MPLLEVQSAGGGKERCLMTLQDVLDLPGRPSAEPYAAAAEELSEVLPSMCELIQKFEHIMLRVAGQAS